MIFSFIEMYKTEHAIELMCRVLRVSRSGYYACRVRSPSHRDRDKAALSERIRHIIGISEAPMEHRRDPCSVARRWREGRKQASSARLMREEGLEGCHQRKKRAHRTTCRDPQAVLPAPDLVEQKFTPEARECLWVADLSYVPTSWEGFDYLAFVLDADSREGSSDGRWPSLSQSGAGSRCPVDMALQRRRPAPGL